MKDELTSTGYYLYVGFMGFVSAGSAGSTRIASGQRSSTEVPLSSTLRVH